MPVPRSTLKIFIVMLSPISGFFLPFQGLRLIFSPGLRRFVVIPLLLNILILGPSRIQSCRLFVIS